METIGIYIDSSRWRSMKLIQMNSLGVINKTKKRGKCIYLRVALLLTRIENCNVELDRISYLCLWVSFEASARKENIDFSLSFSLHFPLIHNFIVIISIINIKRKENRGEIRVMNSNIQAFIIITAKYSIYDAASRTFRVIYRRNI